MVNTDELKKNLMKQYTDEFTKEHGCIMNRRQRKLLEKQVDKIVERTVKKLNREY